MTVAVRSAAADEVAWMVDLAANEGWNPGLRDAQAFRVADPGGFLIAVDDGEPVGGVSCVRYADAFAFFGLYIVVPGRRGEGIGGPLFAAMLEQAGDRTIGLDGVIAQQPSYEGVGFKVEHRSVRWRLDSSVASATAGATDPTSASVASTTTDLATVPFDALTAYDRRCFPARREAFLLAWTTMPGHVARAAHRNGTLDGYAVLRPCREGFKVGPLFAGTPTTAATLLDALLPHAAGAPVFLDIPVDNVAATALAVDHHGVAVFETARMYRGRPPGFDRRKVFGMTTFELG
jgi:GNAT superfamily N-acetyltransferase